MLLNFFLYIYTSVDTEMCCPKGKCGCQYFILLTLKKKIMDTGVLDFFNKKQPELLFLLKVRSCVLISNLHHKKRQTSPFHYGSTFPDVTITVFITILE
jgi:hypothetical protein